MPMPPGSPRNVTEQARQIGLGGAADFRTGIGSAVIHNGTLIPNTEFGHLEVGGKEAEQRAASSVKDKYNWSYEKWAKEVTKVLVAIENAIWPDLFIAGGGISRRADKWIPTSGKPHAGGGGRPAEHGRHRRCRHGCHRGRGALNLPGGQCKPTLSLQWFTAVARPIACDIHADISTPTFDIADTFGSPCPSHRKCVQPKGSMWQRPRQVRRLKSR